MDFFSSRQPAVRRRTDHNKQRPPAEQSRYQDVQFSDGGAVPLTSRLLLEESYCEDLDLINGTHHVKTGLYRAGRS